MSVAGARRQIETTILQWDQVSVHPHRFGGVEFRLGKRELGHIHGDWLVDIPFPTRVRDELVAAGQAEPHHLLADTGWVSFYIRRPEDVEQAIRLLRQSFELAEAQRRRRKKPDGSP